MQVKDLIVTGDVKIVGEINQEDINKLKELVGESSVEDQIIAFVEKALVNGAW